MKEAMLNILKIVIVLLLVYSCSHLSKDENKLNAAFNTDGSDIKNKQREYSTENCWEYPDADYFSCDFNASSVSLSEFISKIPKNNENVKETFNYISSYGIPTNYEISVKVIKYKVYELHTPDILKLEKIFCNKNKCLKNISLNQKEIVFTWGIDSPKDAAIIFGFIQDNKEYKLNYAYGRYKTPEINRNWEANNLDKLPIYIAKWLSENTPLKNGDYVQNYTSWSFKNEPTSTPIGIYSIKDEWLKYKGSGLSLWRKYSFNKDEFLPLRLLNYYTIESGEESIENSIMKTKPAEMAFNDNLYIQNIAVNDDLLQVNKACNLGELENNLLCSSIFFNASKSVHKNTFFLAKSNGECNLTNNEIHLAQKGCKENKYIKCTDNCKESENFTLNNCKSTNYIHDGIPIECNPRDSNFREINVYYHLQKALDSYKAFGLLENFPKLYTSIDWHNSSGGWQKNENDILAPKISIIWSKNNDTEALNPITINHELAHAVVRYLQYMRDSNWCGWDVGCPTPTTSAIFHDFATLLGRLMSSYKCGSINDQCIKYDLVHLDDWGVEITQNQVGRDFSDIILNGFNEMTKNNRNDTNSNRVIFLTALFRTMYQYGWAETTEIRSDTFNCVGNSSSCDGLPIVSLKRQYKTFGLLFYQNLNQSKYLQNIIKNKFKEVGIKL